MSLATGEAVASELAGETISLAKSYQLFSYTQNRQLERINVLMDQIWLQSLELEKTQPYTPDSSLIHSQIGDSSQQLRETSAMLLGVGAASEPNLNVTTDAVAGRKDRYLQNLHALSALDKSATSKMTLPKNVREDLAAMREIRSLPETERDEMWKHYEGRAFGENISTQRVD